MEIKIFVDGYRKSLSIQRTQFSASQKCNDWEKKKKKERKSVTVLIMCN